MKRIERWMVGVLLVCMVATPRAHAAFRDESGEDFGARMAWWRDARFGMFIHWGLYAIPAGEWQGNTGHAEWIRHSAQIPLETYNQFVPQFNPVKFDADAWAKAARAAGMKYLVITSKHHDGFCLWPSKLTEFDVGATPFKRDILKELKKACDKQGIRFCTYHSIMDWHHPDYLPRRDWEAGSRAAEGADFNQYVAYMKGQLAEIVKHYNPGVMWFDGEWEGTWTHEMGLDLYEYVRGLNPDIIINNRVDKGRRGMEGLSSGGQFAGDFGTPEQQIPATGLPGVDWESCMTMNDHWGWNKNDRNWKSGRDLVRKLVDIASKGGNYLLNIGPQPDGTFPPESLDRLAEIGTWMDVNGESIYGTTASPLGSVPFGRCTAKTMKDGVTRLYLHVFDWPADGQLAVGLANNVKSCRLLADPKRAVEATRSETGMRLSLNGAAPDATCSVVVLDIDGAPEPVK